MFADFFFLAAPELLIFSHFPDAKDEKWQLLPESVSSKEFHSWHKGPFTPPLRLICYRAIGSKEIKSKLADKTFSGFVKAYDVSDRRLIIHEAPTEKYLNVGSKLRVRIEAPGCTRMVIRNGAEEFFELTRKGSMFEGEVEVQRADGFAYVAGVFRAEEGIEAILEYSVK